MMSPQSWHGLWPPMGPAPQDRTTTSPRTLSEKVNTLTMSWEVSYVSILDHISFLSWSPGNTIHLEGMHTCQKQIRSSQQLGHAGASVPV